MTCGENDSPADIILRIEKVNSYLIIEGSKNVEYRYYLLDEAVKKIWLYVNQDETIQHIIVVGGAKTPGQVNDPLGVGNDDFDKGLKKSRYGYPIMALYELPHPLTVDELLEEYGVDMAGKCQYVKKALVEAYPLDALKHVRSA